MAPRGPTAKKPAAKRAPAKRPTPIGAAREARQKPPTPFDDPDPPENLRDDQTMPGFDDDHPADAGEQGSYLPPIVPPGYITPPTAGQFANATWLKAGPEITRLVAEVLDWDEFKDIRELDYEVCWRRATSPMRPDGPIFATTEIVQPRIIWESLQLGEERFPRFFVDIHWQHFDDLRRGKEPGSPRTQRSEETPPEGRSASYVHGGILQQHLHDALSHLAVENDIMRKQAPPYVGFPATIQRFGKWREGILMVSKQLDLWPRGGE